MALKLNGRDDKLRRADFRALAATAGVRAVDADAAIDDMLRRLGDIIDRIALPKAVEYSVDGRKTIEDVLALCRSRMEGMS